MGNKSSNASTQAKRKYNNKKYDRIAINVKKGRRDELKTIAAQNGESLNTFINKAIEQRINSEKWLNTLLDT